VWGFLRSFWSRSYSNGGAVDKAQHPLPTAPTPINDIRQSFETAAHDEEHFPSTIDPRILHVRRVAEHMGRVNDAWLLDAGSGKGRFARIVQEQNPQAHVVAFDLALAMLRCVPAPVQTCAGSLTHLPFATESFAGAWATESLEHAVDIERAVAELCRVVKPGGRIAIIDKNAEHWGKLATPAWERWFHAEEMTRLLRRHCHDVHCEPISYWEDVPPDGMFLLWRAIK
jgi:SAM-dependent methyltransferase